MIRPLWLQNLKQSSRARSKSPTSDNLRSSGDQFSHSLPSENRSRSRSRGRSDQDDSWHSAAGSKNSGGRKNSRERQHRRKRDSSSSSYSGDGSSSTQRVIASSEPKYLNARIFVANIIANEVTKDELARHFESYGNIVDVLVHLKNYAFIQFSKEEQAHLAVEGENGSIFKGWRLDVKMASENRKGGGGGSGGRDKRSGGRGGRGGRYDSSERDRSPLRDSYGEPLRGGGGAGPRMPYPLGEFGIRDPYFQDHFRQGFPDPWMADDPYRRDPYPDPYRDPYRMMAAAAAPPPVIECEIFVLNAQLRSYGVAVEQRVKENIITAVSVMPEGRTPQQLVEELTTQGTLFAIFINPQNELHRSLTLNILHGTPQEHRNMPLDDAVVLVGRSFQKYVESVREKAQSSSSHVFLPPSSEMSYLLNLLADNRALTVAELNTVINYLQERRDKLIAAESRPIFKDETFGKTPPSQMLDHAPMFPNQQSIATDNKDVTSSHKDLSSNVFNLFASAGGTVQGVPPANGTQQQQQLFPPKLPSGTPAPPPPPTPSHASLINFDNPNVQKALDNLIHSSPGLLKNMNMPLMSTQIVPTSLGSVGGNNYGGIISNQSQGHMQNNPSQTVLQAGYEGVQAGYDGVQAQGMSNVVQGIQGPFGQSTLQGTYNMPNQGHTGTSYIPSAQSRY